MQGFEFTMNEHPFLVATAGTTASGVSLFVSLLPHLTAGVQFATACFGLIAAVCTAIYMSRKVRKQNHEKHD
jgi:membrane associated rhomboid family serine protease